MFTDDVDGFVAVSNADEVVGIDINELLKFDVDDVYSFNDSPRQRLSSGYVEGSVRSISSRSSLSSGTSSDTGITVSENQVSRSR